MHLEASYATLNRDEREQTPCPRRTRRRYSLAIRISTFLIAAPALLILFACIFHIPLLPIILILALAGGVRAMERPLTDLALRLLWPLHVRWLRWRHPERLDIHHEPRLTWHHKNTAVTLDPGLTTLTVGALTCDLTRPWSLELERAEDLGTLLRLRIFQRGVAPLVIASHPPDPDQLLERLGERWDGLPRREGDAAILPWDSFVTFVHHLRDAHRAVHGPLPATLEDALTSAEAPQPTTVTAPA